MNIERILDEENRYSGRGLVFRIDGALDALESGRFLKDIQQVLDETGAMGLVLLCDTMPYLTSSGLRAIMALGKRLRQKGGNIVVCGLAGLAKDVFTTSGFAELFPVAETIEEAHSLMETCLSAAAPAQ